MHYDYGFRVYDPRLGRFLSLDPLFAGYPYYTPYQFAGNKPIWAIDLDGLEELTKTRSRVITITHIYNQQQDLIEGEFEIFSSTEQKFMTIKSGSQITRKGEVGGHVFIENKFYYQQHRKKNGKWTFRSRRVIKPTDQFVPADPNDHKKPIDNGITEKTEPVIKTKTSTSITDKVIKESVKESVLKETATDFVTEGISETPVISNLDDLQKIEFKSFKKDFAIPKPQFFLDPIADKLKRNSKNNVTIYLTTFRSKDYVVKNNWFTKDYLMEDLMNDREKVIRSHLEKDGVAPGQIKVIHRFNIKETQNMKGSIEEFQDESKL